MECVKCGQDKSEDEFYWRSPRERGRRRDCKACCNSRSAQWFKDHPDKAKERSRRYLQSHPEVRKTMRLNYYAKLKTEAFDHYGRVCVCCGEDEPKFLALDHVNNDGNVQRQDMSSGTDFLRWLKREGYPDSIQVLCHNCNVGKHLNGGVCPHDVRTRETPDQ